MINTAFLNPVKKKAKKKASGTVINLRLGGAWGNPQTGGAFDTPSPVTDTSKPKKKKKKFTVPTGVWIAGGAVIVGIIVYGIWKRSHSMTIGQRIAAYGSKAAAAGRNFVANTRV
jgi:hypothetical protein